MRDTWSLSERKCLRKDRKNFTSSGSQNMREKIKLFSIRTNVISMKKNKKNKKRKKTRKNSEKKKNFLLSQTGHEEL